MGRNEYDLPQYEKPPVSKDGVVLAFSDRALGHFDFMLPEAEEGVLTVRQGDDTLSVGIVALDGDTHTALPMYPHIAPDDHQPAMHAWGTQFLPYTVLPDGVRYGIRIQATRGLAGSWSQPRYEAYQEPGKYITLEQQEALVQRRSGLVVFARLNDGEVVTAMRRIPAEQFHEIGSLLGTAETPEEGDEMVMSERVRRDGANGTGEPFIFRQLAHVGTADNNIRDRAGEVDVIVCTADIKRIIEIRTKPLILPPQDLGPSLTLGNFRSYDATTRGTTEFGAARSRQVNLIQGENVTPAFRFRFKLVGSE